MDTRDISTLATSAYSQAFQLGGNNDGAWRFFLKGGGSAANMTSFNIQVRQGGSWVDKWSLKQY